jgi:ribokinase
MYDIICVGSSTIDLYIKPESSQVLYDKSNKECISFPVGGKILLEEIEFSTGGGGTNAAVSLVRLGFNVAYLGKMGLDDYSNAILQNLSKEGIDTSLVSLKKNAKVGFSVVIDDKGRDRTILSFRGSNGDLRWDEINKSELKAKWFYFSSMMKESFKTLIRLSEYAEQKNIQIAFVLSPFLAEQGIKKLKNILKRVSVLVLNKEEAGLLVGEKDYASQFHDLAKAGPTTISITDGAKGAYVFNDGCIYYGKPRRVKIVETTGAGDAFASTFLAGLMKKNNISFALKLAMTNAESVIGHHGAKEKLLTFKEASKKISRRAINLIQ